MEEDSEEDLEEYLEEELFLASERGDLDRVASLISRGANVNYQKNFGSTALHWECSFGHADIVDLLIRHNADINKTNDSGYTPLHKACSNGHTDTVALLLAHNADVNVKNKYGNTPLTIACYNGHTDTAALLLAHNADVNVKNKDSDTPLHFACYHGHTDKAALLLAHNADVNVKNKFGETPLHNPCQEGHTYVVDLLLEHGADVNITDDSGYTPLHFACLFGRTDTVALLLSHNADINVKNEHGKTPLHHACQKGHTYVVDLLLEHGANVSITDIEGKIPQEYLPKKKWPRQWKAQERAQEKMAKDFPDEIRGSKAKRIFLQAISKGTAQVFHIRLMVIGHYGVGKTTITKALLQDIEQICDTTSTDGIDIHVGRSIIDIKTKKWKKRNKDLAKRASVRQKIKHIMYNVRRQEILEKPSWNPFSDNWIFKRKPAKSQMKPNEKPKVEKVSDVNASLTDLLSGKERKPLSSNKPVIKSSVFSKFQPQLSAHSEGENLLNVASSNIKEFLPQDEALLPQKDEDINIEEFQKDICELEIWDFGGQSVFYTTHQAFLSPRCIYPLVIDGRKRLHDEIDDQELIPGELTSHEIEEFLRFWIFSVVTYAKGKVPGFPKIIPVITHMDQIPEDQRRRKVEYIFKEIERICNEYQVQDHIIIDVRLSINALNPDDPAYDVLRDVILDVAQTYPNWGEIMPATWVPVEHSMMQMKDMGYKILPVSSIQEINRQSQFQPLDDEELRSFLDFQHSLGNILFFSDDYLRHNVIMHPKWLVDALRSIITAERFLKNDETKTKMLQNLSDSGTLDCSLLAQLWNNDEYREFCNNAEYLLHTMVKMDLLAEPVGYDEDGAAVEIQQFIVPSMIRWEVSSSLIKELSPSESSAALLFTFHGKFLPKGIFNRLIASCVNMWPLETLDEKSVISAGFCSFRVDVSHRVNIKMLPYQILTTVTATQQSQSVSASLCGGIRHVLLNQLTRICQIHKDVEEDNEERNKKFYIEIPCCATHLRCTRKFEDISCNTTQLCGHHREQEKSTNFTIWIRDTESYKYPQDEECTRLNPCPCVTDLTLTTQELGRISRRLQGNPENVIIVLDVESKLLFDEKDHYKHGRIGIREFYFRILMKAEHNILKPGNLQKELCTADENNKHVMCKVIRRRTAVLESQLRDDCMFKIPSEKILDQLSSRLTPNEAFHLFTELGLDIVEIDRTRINFPRDSLEQIKHMLRVWRSQKEPRPTFKILEEALSEVAINIGELRQIAPEIMKMK